MTEPVSSKAVLITGAARRVGRSLALACARAGYDVAVHYGTSAADAESLAGEIRALGRRALLLPADLADAQQTAALVEQAATQLSLTALINNASIFEPLEWDSTTLEDWNRNLAVNLTAPFLLSQTFARCLPAGQNGSILNLLDWRALRPGPDHLPYTISKVGLAGLTRSLAAALAPRIRVNGMALGAILPPNEGGNMPPNLGGSMPPNEGGNITPPDPGPLAQVPAQRWASLAEVDVTALFLLDGPGYITGEIIHVDGGRHVL